MKKPRKGALKLAFVAVAASLTLAACGSNPAPTPPEDTSIGQTSESGDVAIYTVDSKEFTCHVADNTKRYEQPGLACDFKVAASGLTQVKMAVGDDIELAVDPKSGCITAENSKRYSGISIACAPAAAAG